MKHSVELVRGLKEAAIAVRQEIVKMTSNAKSGHLGGNNDYHAKPLPKELVAQAIAELGKR